MRPVPPAVVRGALLDLAATGIVAADVRWLRYAVERRRLTRHVPGAVKRRAPHRARRPRYSLEDVEAALVGVRTAPLRIVREAPAPPAEVDASVLGEAALPRALLVPDAMLAHLLREHDLHMETGAPILPWSEPLPQWLLDGVARAGRPRVLVLHDVGGEPRDLPLATANVGLREAHVKRLRLPSGEAAAIPPDRLLRALRRLLLGVAPEPPRRWLPPREAGFV